MGEIFSSFLCQLILAAKDTRKKQSNSLAKSGWYCGKVIVVERRLHGPGLATMNFGKLENARARSNDVQRVLASEVQQ